MSSSILRRAATLAVVFALRGLADAATIQVPSAQAPTITIAINIASSGDEIVVAPGTYFEALNLGGKTLTIRSSGGPETTIIDGFGQFKSVVSIISNEGAATLIEGFTIRNGIAESASPGNRGGGIHCNLTSPTIRNCILTKNRAVNGGAFYANGGSPILIECAFVENTATTSGGFGGAVYLNNATLTATDCSFELNVAVGSGGALRGSGSSGATLLRCDFTDNTGSANGGAIEITTGAVAYAVTECRFRINITNGPGGAVQISSATGVNHQFRNCVFDDNAASGNGGAVQVSGRVELINCTVARNSAGGNGGAVLTSGSGVAQVRNSVVWSNTPNGIAGPNLTVAYTCHQTPIVGTGNIAVDPAFVDLGGGDLRLSMASPCIDAGNTTLLPTSIASDLDGLPRAVNVLVAPTGVAAFGYVVDMGAFEYPAPIAPPACPGDLDGDGIVGPADLATLLGGWGPCD